jgi:tetratricopeptide (TPR) repeat protein
MRKKQFEAASVYLRKTQEIAPNFLKCLINLGYVLSELKENDSAIEIYKNILKIKPSDSDAYYSIGQNISHKAISSKQKSSLENYQKALSEALAFNEKALVLKPNNPLYLLGKATILKFLKLLKKVNAILEKFLLNWV